MPLFLIANEFFDCLPISQYQKKGAVWHERMVTSNGTGADAKLSFVWVGPYQILCLILVRI